MKLNRKIDKLSSWDLNHLCPSCAGPAFKESHLEHMIWDNQYVCQLAHQWPCKCNSKNEFYLYTWIANSLLPKKMPGMICKECLIEVYKTSLGSNIIDFICFRCGKVWWKKHERAIK